MKILSSLLLAVVSLSLVHAHVTSWKSPNQLQPVHSLYIKPSADGTSGDLYVAATEENGVKSQWLTDQPVNFLAATTPQATVPLTTFTVTRDEPQSTQKRAIVSSPPVQYAYAVPVASSEALPYPYAAAVTTTDATAPQQCDPKTPYQYPYQYFYPQMMSAYANAKSILKDSGISDETASSILSHASSMWSSPYAYPMYVMVDPSAWTQTQTQTQNQPSQTTSNNASNEKA